MWLEFGLPPILLYSLTERKAGEQKKPAPLVRVTTDFGPQTNKLKGPKKDWAREKLDNVEKFADFVTTTSRRQ